MSETSNSTKSWLGFRKKSLEAELLALHPDLMEEYIETCSALLGIERSGAKHVISSTEYTPYRYAVDAIESYLSKVNEFTDQEAVIKALVDGGWDSLGEENKRRAKILESIRYNTLTSKRLVLQYGQKGDPLGKAEWIKSESPPEDQSKINQ